MTSLHSLWALLLQLGLEPGVLLAKAGEKATLYAGSKAARLAGKQVSGAAKAILAYWNSTVEASFPAYLQSRLTEVDARERPEIVEAAFSDWIASRTTESAQLSRLLFRLVYLRALIDHCIELPVLAQSRLGLDDVWVPQTFRQHSPEPLRQRQAEQARFPDLEEAISSCRSPLVLLGDSGAGKSTQLRKLVLDVARRQLDLTDFEQLIVEPLPIYIQAETMASEPGDLTTTLSRVIARELGLRLPFPLPDGFLDSRQPGAAASLLVVIDGLDEIAPNRRDTLVASLRRHGDNFDIVLGSRARLPQHDIAHVEIEEPTSAQADALVRKLTKLHGIMPSRWPGLPRNPLVLTLAAMLQRQDSLSRATLYREFLIDRMSRSLDPAVPDPKAGLRLLEACALAGGDLAGNAEALTAIFLPAHVVGLARGRIARRLLVSTGAIREMGKQLSFLHESFRSFLKAELLARRHRPSPAPWDKVSPFREGW